MNKEEIKNKFLALFSKEPLLVRSPGRVNLIGEHTDYNDGFVLPAAIDKEVICALSGNESDICHFHAYDLDESFEISVGQLEKSEPGWPNYLMGVVDQLQKAGHKISGFNCVIGGNIPIGAGLSSSAAIECAMMYGLDRLFNLKIDKLDMVKMAQKAENEFVGVNCGIMDQFASMFGKYDEVIKLDCRSLEYQYYHFDMSDFILVLCDTKVKHSLASSEYNTRRRECEKGVKFLQQRHPEVKSLRDATLDMFERHQEEMDPVILKRCRYVVEENIRVEKACEDIFKGDFRKFGEKMYQSHYGLRDDYEVSCKELDFLVEQTENDDKVLGARMMGGGFGGCTLNLIEKEYLDNFIRKMTTAYKDGLNMDLEVYVASIAGGSSIIE